MQFVVRNSPVMETARDVSAWQDAELVQSIARRSSEARTAERVLCQRFARPILLYGMRHLRDEERARELVQDVLVVVLEAIRGGKIDDPSRLGSFVLGTCRYAVWDLRRGERRRQQVAEEATAGAVASAAPTWDLLDLPQLERCLGTLATRELTVIRLCFHEDRSADEIGQLLALNPGNIRVIRHRALQRLGDCLQARREQAT
jgi:RNA polymerase sigma-70 factor (ECF subfamily)